MENNQERSDLSKIRHFKGTVKDFKNYWDEMAGTETNAFGTQNIKALMMYIQLAVLMIVNIGKLQM